MSVNSNSVAKSLRQAQRAMQNGEPEAARAMFLSVLKEFPDNKPAQEELSRMDKQDASAVSRLEPALEKIRELQDQGLNAEALVITTDLLQSAGGNAKLLELHAENQRKIGDFSAALKTCETSLKLHGPACETLRCIALCFFEKSQYSLALEYLEQALQFAPNDFMLNLAKANCFVHLSRHVEAIEVLSKLIIAQPGNQSLLISLGTALNSSGKKAEAKICYEAITGTGPDKVAALAGLAALASSNGEKEAAEAALSEALVLDPKNPRLHRSFSGTITYTPTHPHLAELNRLLAHPGMSKGALAQLRFALFKAHQDFGDYDTAFGHLSKGNSLRNSHIGYTLQSDEALFSYLRHTVATPPPAASGDSPFRPIFVVGLPRSGTTVTEQILCGAEGVHGAGELPFVANVILRHVREMQMNGETSISAERTMRMRAELVSLMSHAAQGSPIVVDKMPVNFRWVGILAAVFPEAKFVYTNRSAMNVCWSLYKVCFTSAGNGFCYDQVNVAKYQKMSQDLMAHWKGLFPDRIYTLDFEELTANQEEEAKKLVSFCDLDWSDSCLDLSNRDRAIFTASQHQARQPIYETKEPDWFKYAAHLTPMRHALGLN